MKKNILIYKIILIFSVVTNLCLFVAFLLSRTNKNEITGIARNYKSGATIVVTEQTYYIEGKDFWEENLIGKTLNLKGRIYQSDKFKALIRDGRIVSSGTYGNDWFIQNYEISIPNQNETANKPTNSN